MSISIRPCNYDWNLKAVLIKNITNNYEAARYTVSPGANIPRWKQQKQEIMPRVTYCYKYHAIKRCNCKVDTVGRQHLPPPYPAMNRKTMPEAHMPMGLIIGDTTTR